MAWQADKADPCFIGILASAQVAARFDLAEHCASAAIKANEAIFASFDHEEVRVRYTVGGAASAKDAGELVISG